MSLLDFTQQFSKALEPSTTRFYVISPTMNHSLIETNLMTEKAVTFNDAEVPSHAQDYHLRIFSVVKLRGLDFLPFEDLTCITGYEICLKKLSIT